MAIKIISTKNVASNGVKCLVYGPAGIGKTRLAATAKDGIIISAEAGLLSLAEIDYPAIEVTSLEEVEEVLVWVKSSKEAEQYTTLHLDSITEIAEVLLVEYKAQEKDPRNAYGLLADKASTLIREFRDIQGKNVYFSAKQVKKTDDDTGITSIAPGMPGNQLYTGLPYFFDEVFAMKLGKLEDGTVYNYLQTKSDFQYVCKDRSGKLDLIEKPDLNHIFNKVSKGGK